jgi:hypothetical protein
MISRRAFEQLGGFDPALSVRYALDLQLRAYSHPELTLAQQRARLATRIKGNTCSEYELYGLYCRYVRRDITVYHFARDAAHQWIDYRDIRECE